MTTDTIIEKKIETAKKLKLPDKYKVVIHNDDHTPVDFVIELLMTTYNHSDQSAVAVTLEVHNKGKGCAGIYTYEIAEQKIIDSTEMARANGYPLTLKLEVE